MNKNSHKKNAWKSRRAESGRAWEWNFDGLAGPSHNYAGLPEGNLASMSHKGQASHPKAAALQGLEKMKLLMDLGCRQAVLPPHARPDLDFLRRLGLSGRPEQILRKAWEISPDLLAACYSASSMWAANSAVTSPSADTKDQKVHFTPANMVSWLHRSLEAGQTSLILRKIFSDPRHFAHHPPLPAQPVFSDEGAANHSRLCASYGLAGAELFVYGRSGFAQKDTIRRASRPLSERFASRPLSERFASRPLSERFASRQTLEASKMLALRHQLRPEKTVFAKQNPQAVAAGVFHNDVAFASDQNLVFFHELAFADTKKVLRQLEEALRPSPLLKITVREKEISLADAVSSYLFNSQLLPLPSPPEGERRWLLLAPSECREIPSVRDYLSLIAGNSPVHKVRFAPLRESMKNGGGPACLRLRIVLTEKEAAAARAGAGAFLDQTLYASLKAWIHRHYRERLLPEDLLDPLLIREIQEALDELSRILGLEGIYPFQQTPARP